MKEKPIDVKIDLDQFLKELAATDVSKLDDTQLCQLALRVRMVTTVLSKVPKETFTEQQSSTFESFMEYEEMLTELMLERGYRVVDSDELLDEDPEAIAERLVSCPMQTLFEWQDVLEELAPDDEKKAQMLRFVKNELQRRFAPAAGDLAN